MAVTREQLKSFINNIYDELEGIKDFGHSLHVNDHEEKEIWDLLMEIEDNFDKLNDYIQDSYGL